MADRLGLRRAELALAALGMTAVLVVIVVAVDVAHFHGLALDPHVALGVVDLVVIARGGASLVRRLRAQHAFLRRLPVSRETVVHGHRVRVIPGRSFEAFCAGLLAPAIYVSEATLQTGQAELRAILAHEEHHRARRDPLRLLLAGVVSDALRPLPPFASLGEREAALADLAADAATVDALGDRAPLASALVRFDADTGVAPERIDRLVGAGRPPTIPSALLVAAGVLIAGFAALAITMPLVDCHPDEELLIATCLPACVAASRAGAWLRPAA